MKQLRRPSLVEGLTAIMLVVLPVLAVLQYRWLGRVSDAERERKRAGIETATTQVQLAFDGEIASMYTALGMDAETYARRDWGRYAERVEAWKRWSKVPGFLSEINLVEYSLDGPVSSWRFDPEARTFVAAQMRPETIDFVRPAAPDALPDRPPGSRPFGFEYSPTVSRFPALVIPVAPSSAAPFAATKVPRSAFLVVLLDSKGIPGIAPTLAREAFGWTGELEYDFQWPDLAYVPRPEYQGDASTVLFSLTPEEISRLARGTSPDTDAPSFRRMITETPEGETVDHFVIARADPGYRLAVTHRAGSLEAAVAEARTRNLALGFGVLLLLAATVVALVVASRRAQRLARQQVEFVAGVSHELRTPLAVICSAAENLSDGIVTSEPQVRRYGALIEGEGRRLAELVEQVLEYAGANANRARYAMRPLELAPVVEEAATASRRAASDAGVELEVDLATELPDVTGDPAALRRALENLIGNAVKYSEAGGTVRVAARRDARAVVVAVADRGRGIAAADLPHIFEPFYRGRDAVDAQIRGSGLGLSLARRVVAAHGGTISVESHAGEGSTFTVRLPAAAPETASEPEQESAYEQTHPARRG